MGNVGRMLSDGMGLGSVGGLVSKADVCVRSSIDHT